MSDIRYFRWRTAIHKNIWVLDQHWYKMLGALYVSEHPELRTHNEKALSMGMTVPHDTCEECERAHKE